MPLLRQLDDGSNMTSSLQVKRVRQVLLQGGKEKKIAGTKWAIVQHFATDISQQFSSQLCRVRFPVMEGNRTFARTLSVPHKACKSSGIQVCNRIERQ